MDDFFDNLSKLKTLASDGFQRFATSPTGGLGNEELDSVFGRSSSANAKIGLPPSEPSYGFNPVSPGVSKSERTAADVKIAQLHAANVERRQRRNSLEDSALETVLSDLRSKSGKDTLSFAAKGDQVEGDFSPKGRGSFRKTKFQNESTRSVDKMVKSGIPSQLADAIQRMSDAETEQQGKAAMAAAQLIPERRSPQQENVQILSEAMKSRDPQAALQIAFSILRLKGLSEEDIQSLMGSTQGK